MPRINKKSRKNSDLWLLFIYKNKKYAQILQIIAFFSFLLLKNLQIFLKLPTVLVVMQLNKRL